MAAPARIIIRNILLLGAVVLAVYLVYRLRQPITWVLVAAFIAVAVSGPIEALQRRIHRRGLSIAIVYLVLILIPLAILGLIGGTVVRQGTELVTDLPRYVTEASEFVRQNATFRRFEADYDITGKLQEQAQTLPTRVGDAAGTLSGFGVALVNSIFAIVTILILSLFLVGSGRRWVDGAISLRPSHEQARLQRTADRIAQAVGGYVGGALAQAVIAGVTTYIVLLILGVPFAAPLAVVVALFDLIPLIGATVGAAVVGVVTLFTNFPVATIVWAIWSIVYQQLENTVIQPQIQKRAVNVPPFLVIVAVLFGSTLFGILGALLAVPVAASILVLAREFIRLRRYEPEPEPPPAAVAAPPVAGPA